MEKVGGGRGNEEFGWIVKMTHKFPEKWNQNIWPRWNQLHDLIYMFIRYFFWWIKTKIIGRRQPFIDLIMLKGKQIYGVPLGGLGAGSIGRGFKGEFCRFQMTPGLYTYDIAHGDQFIVTVRDSEGKVTTYQKVLSAAGPPGTLKSWDWSYRPEDGTYRGLYPRAWYTYNIPEENLILICKQISPVIPNNYTDSSLPCSIFEWEIKNEGKEKKFVSITFTFQSGAGDLKVKSHCHSQTFNIIKDGIEFSGVALDHTVKRNNTTYSIAALKSNAETSISYMSNFDLKSGEDLWEILSKTGELEKVPAIYEIPNGNVGMAVSALTQVLPSSKSNLVFSLVWHQPLIYFNNKEHLFTRRYVRFFPQHEENEKGNRPLTLGAIDLTEYSMKNYSRWDGDIEKWQNEILSQSALPSWFKSCLLNELYYLSDGGSVWVEYDNVMEKHTKDPDIRNSIGRFAYLEGHEYRMYNTYDVHFYASFALMMLFPGLEASIQYDMADAIKIEDKTQMSYLFDGKSEERKAIDSVPHDLGDPAEDPYSHINSYLMHDVSQWRDLNLKFVLTTYRDFMVFKDKKFLKDMLPLCDLVMRKSLVWDTDNDGLIENSGAPDQTYDTWLMKGPSAYCGGLWVASLFAMVEMIKAIQQSYDVKFYEDLFSRASAAFETKLWTGKYYKFDSSEGPNSMTIMSDQLCGHWILAAAGVDDSAAFSKSNVESALKTIYQNNVLKYAGGTMGAVNGMTQEGEIDLFSLQSEECWTGVTYALAATLIHHGMIKEGFKTAEGIYRTVYEKIGLGWETPEALYIQKKYRSIGYMRPLSVWAMFHAWKDQQNKADLTNFNS